MLSRYSEQCILLFVSWFVSASLFLVHFFFHLIGLQPAPNDDARRKAKAALNRIGTGLLKQSKGDGSSARKDILSVLAQANTMEEKAHQMSDSDILSRAYIKPFWTGAYYLIYAHQRSLLSSLLVMKQQGTHVHHLSAIL